MKKLFVIVGLFLIISGVSGCGGAASADSLLTESINDMNALADAMEKKEPEAKIAELKKKMEATIKKADAIKLSEEEKKKLMDKHQEAMMKAAFRLAALGVSPDGTTTPAVPSKPAGTGKPPAGTGKKK